jgi:RNA polymerase sigma-70 factor (ECF subfamily)
MRDRLTRLFLRFRERRDGRALARLFDRLAPELLGVAVHLIDDPFGAEDLVQETFLVAIEHAQRFDQDRSV